ncbi:hypothetical protein DX902_00020 [Paenibacillus jamilae]|uniref:Rad52/Rad22 family DNA repair protein n=1 Tax=Paenibacillus TaxID=44249 RepID=UPI000E3D8569|nr:Rad52/Rad22 family DNA repair protein [Paenibacillus jamilae]RFT99987.1 hypothetical protein DX902_00020 [Paenibacillus jamilae]
MTVGDRCYISGQSITERLNQVLDVGFWKYEGLYETEKIIHDLNGKNPRVKIFVRFSFFNSELQEWVHFIDVGSEQVKPGMNEGDATKSAITDAMKKCASRIGVGSDLYNGKITWDKQRLAIIFPEHYAEYYQEQGWETLKLHTTPPSTIHRSAQKVDLTNKLKSKPSAIQNKIKAIWKELAGNLDGLDEWYEKKRQEQVTDQQIYNLPQKKLQDKKKPASA